jgi:ribosome maturation factor RimP
MNDMLEGLVAAELDRLGLDLVELRRAGSRASPVLDIRIDRRDDVPVSVDDCATASRAIEARLDAENAVGDRYVLEVSSPGVERALKSGRDWRRFVGRHANVLSDELDGRAEVEILGVHGEAGAEVVTVRHRGGERQIPLARVREARLAFHW